MAASTEQKVIVEFKSDKFYVAMVMSFDDDEGAANDALKTKQDEINAAKASQASQASQALYDAILVKKDRKHYLVTIHSEHNNKASAEAAK